jgi:hypothetical protein
MEEVDDEDTHLPNVAPLNPSRLLELSNGSNDEDPPALIKVDDDSKDTKEVKRRVCRGRVRSVIVIIIFALC